MFSMKLNSDNSSNPNIMNKEYHSKYYFDDFCWNWSTIIMLQNDYLLFTIIKKIVLN